jgi:hypothetical protein
LDVVDLEFGKLTRMRRRSGVPNDLLTCHHTGQLEVSRRSRRQVDNRDSIYDRPISVVRES